MYMTLTEEQAQEIRKGGISVIQFKNVAKKVRHFFRYTFPELIDMVVKDFKFAVQVITDVWMIFGLRLRLFTAHANILYVADINL